MSARATLADRGYRPYTGPLTSPSRRFLIVARCMTRLWLSQRFVIFLLLVGMLPPFITAIVMAVTSQIAESSEPSRYVALMLLAPWGQLLMGSLLTLFVAAPSIAEDVERHALPFYLARPISARQYLAGKALAAGVLIAALTVVPALALSLEEVGLCTRAELGPALLLVVRAPLAAALLAAGLLAPALLISTWVRRRALAQVVFGVVLYLPWVLLRPLVSLTGSWWPRLLAWPAIVQHVARAAMGATPTDAEGPLSLALLIYVFVVAGSTVLALRKLEQQGGA